jgi:hypothetical protein
MVRSVSVSKNPFSRKYKKRFGKSVKVRRHVMNNQARVNYYRTMKNALKALGAKNKNVKQTLKRAGIPNSLIANVFKRQPRTKGGLNIANFQAGERGLEAERVAAAKAATAMEENHTKQTRTSSRLAVKRAEQLAQKAIENAQKEAERVEKAREAAEKAAERAAKKLEREAKKAEELKQKAARDAEIAAQEAKIAAQKAHNAAVGAELAALTQRQLSLGEGTLDPSVPLYPLYRRVYKNKMHNNMM